MTSEASIAEAVLYRHLNDARDWRDYHRARQGKGAFEAALASHKIMWLRDLIHEITGTLIPLDKLK